MHFPELAQVLHTSPNVVLSYTLVLAVVLIISAAFAAPPLENFILLPSVVDGQRGRLRGCVLARALPREVRRIKTRGRDERAFRNITWLAMRCDEYSARGSGARS